MCVYNEDPSIWNQKKTKTDNCAVRVSGSPN